jgi:transglutaminase-like putative cysteine protease
MIFRIRHTTRFDYDAPAYESHNEVRLTPRPSPGQRCIESRIEVSAPAAVLAFRDSFGNVAHAISVHRPHESLEIVATSVVERSEPRALRPVRIPFADFLGEDEARTRDHFEFLTASPHVPFSDRLRKLFWSARPAPSERVDDYAKRLVHWVRDQFEYDPAATHVHSSVDDILTAGGGVCQDFAHLTIGLLRLAGLPARYVSGYFAPRLADQTTGEQASHAWVEVLLPGSGWTGFDPTHRCRTTEQHVRLAVGRDYTDATPLRGVYRSAGGTGHMRVEVAIATGSEIAVRETSAQAQAAESQQQ